MSRALVAAAAAALLLTTPGCGAGAPRGDPAEDAFDVAVRRGQTVARDRLAATTARLGARRWPNATTARGRWATTGAGRWTSGFLPGALWLAYQESADPVWRSRAARRQAGLAGQASNTTTHDVGFMILDSFGNGYRLTRDGAYRRTVLRAAASLATRYSDAVGAIRSWNGGSWRYPVIVDNMMNLELLFWAADHGGRSVWREIAIAHALTTARDHVRRDGSTYHVVDYDPATGDVWHKGTHQGASAASTWARGQAWAIHGFATAYRETGDPRMLATARRVADWFATRLPPGGVPYWDFSARSGASRDSSAAAIAASGLLELARLEPDGARAARSLGTARTILAALSSPAYLSRGSGGEAALLHGTANAPTGHRDTGLIYGDYYYLQALLRLRLITPAAPPWPVTGAVASGSDGNAAANAVDGSLATRWSADGDGQWLRLDLGEPRRVTKVTVAVHRGDARAARFDLQASADGVGWRTLDRVLSSGSTTERETYDVPDTTARYVRVVGRGAVRTTWNSIAEVAVPSGPR